MRKPRIVGAVQDAVRLARAEQKRERKAAKRIKDADATARTAANRSAAR